MSPILHSWHVFLLKCQKEWIQSNSKMICGYGCVILLSCQKVDAFDAKCELELELQLIWLLHNFDPYSQWNFVGGKFIVII